MTFGVITSISEENKSLIKNTQNNIKKRIKSFIEYYKEKAQDFIDKGLKIKSLKYLDIQVKIEKIKNNSISPKNKRNKEEFEKLISSFLNENFYYIAQKYLIYRFIKDLFENLCEKLSNTIISKMKNFLLSNERRL